MKKIIDKIRAVLSKFFPPQAMQAGRASEKNWARDQILKMAKLGGKLIL